MKKDTLKISLLLGLFIATIIVSIITSPKIMTPFLNKKTTSLLNQNNYVGVIDIFGPITFSSSTPLISKIGAENILQQIEQMEKDDRIKALILKINSPGGTVGSIGVIMGNINITNFVEKHGITFEVYKSGQYKDSLSSWKQPTEKERRLLQNVVNNVHSQFEKAVINHRNLNKKQAHSLTQGQIFTGEQAKENKLIDELGTFEDSLYYASKLLGSKEKPTIISKASSNIYNLLNFWENQIGGHISGLLFTPQLFKLQ